MVQSHRAVRLDGVDVFYREAGDPSAPTLVLLHGFPTSSVMYRTLIDELADEFHLVAPDYPGFGLSSAPPADRWEYTFDHLADVVDGLLDAIGVRRFALFVHDYGAPVGFRLAVARPERVTGIVSQNGNAYDEGLTPFWDPLRRWWAGAATADDEQALAGLTAREGTHWQYTHGVPAEDLPLVDPSLETLDQALLDRPGNADVQRALLADYGVNPGRYAAWQEYLRTYQPPVLAAWGRHDEIFGADGARAFARDVKEAEIRLLDAGHFPLTTRLAESAELVRGFLRRLPA